MKAAVARWFHVLAWAQLWFWGVVLAHPDLKLQIQEISRQILSDPSQAALYLKRGDLYRRHEQWQLAAGDFSTARSLEPENPEIDWLEGRFLVFSGHFEMGATLLSRFLEHQPGHVGALLSRAHARWNLRNPQAAAEDFVLAIRHTSQPSPGLFRSLAITQVAAGPDAYPEAAATLADGARHFPFEVSLLGMGFDLAVIQTEHQLAASYMSQVPERIAELDIWQFRQGLLACIKGNAGLAASRFQSLGLRLQTTGNQRRQTWAVPINTLQALAADPDISACRSAALAMFTPLEP